jgi:hypothetical protein
MQHLLGPERRGRNVGGFVDLQGELRGRELINPGSDDQDARATGKILGIAPPLLARAEPLLDQPLGLLDRNDSRSLGDRQQQ